MNVINLKMTYIPGFILTYITGFIINCKSYTNAIGYKDVVLESWWLGWETSPYIAQENCAIDDVPMSMGFMPHNFFEQGGVQCEAAIS